MTLPFKFKSRPLWFLAPEHQDPDVILDYVRELHEVLWRFVRTEYPDASGELKYWVPVALAAAERRAPAADIMKVHDDTIAKLRDWVEHT